MTFPSHKGDLKSPKGTIPIQGSKGYLLIMSKYSLFTLLIFPSICPPGKSWWEPRSTAHSVLKNFRQMSKQLCQVTATPDRHISIAVNWQSSTHSRLCVGVGFVHVCAGVCVYINMETKGQPYCCPSRVIHLDFGNRSLTGLGLTDQGRLAIPKTSRIYLSLPLQNRNYKSGPHHTQLSCVGAGDRTSV